MSYIANSAESGSKSHNAVHGPMQKCAVAARTTTTTTTLATDGGSAPEFSMDAPLSWPSTGIARNVQPTFKEIDIFKVVATAPSYTRWKVKVFSWRLFAGANLPSGGALVPRALPGDIFYDPSQPKGSPIALLGKNMIWTTFTTSANDSKESFAHPDYPGYAFRYFDSDKAPVYVKLDSWNKASWRRRRSNAPPVSLAEEQENTLDLTALSIQPTVVGGRALLGSEVSRNSMVVPMRPEVGDLNTGSYDVCMPWIPGRFYSIPSVQNRFDDMTRQIYDVIGAESPNCDGAGYVEFDAREDDLARKIDEALGRNNIVRVRNYRGETGLLSWEHGAEEIRPLNAPVTPHSQTLRLLGKDPRRPMSYGQFLSAAANPAKCYNLLDATSLHLPPPAFLRPLMAERIALNATSNLGVLWKGIKMFEGDMLNPLNWYLAAHAGYYTDSHHDACGFVTFAWVQCGSKIWAWPRSIFPPAQGCDYAMAQTIRHVNDEPTNDRWYRVRLVPGDVLIQPPNTVHRVYTAEKSIVKGGHFFTNRTLHLTEMGVHVDVDHNAAATNEDHPAVPRFLARMVIALALGSPHEMPIRCLLSLARLVMFDQEYLPGSIPEQMDEDDDNGPAPSPAGPAMRLAGEEEPDWSDGEDNAQRGEWRPSGKVFDKKEFHAEQEADILTAKIILTLLMEKLELPPIAETRAFDYPGLRWDDCGSEMVTMPTTLPVSKIMEAIGTVLEQKKGAKTFHAVLQYVRNVLLTSL